MSVELPVALSAAVRRRSRAGWRLYLVPRGMCAVRATAIRASVRAAAFALLALAFVLPYFPTFYVLRNSAPTTGIVLQIIQVLFFWAPVFWCDRVLDIETPYSTTVRRIDIRPAEPGDNGAVELVLRAGYGDIVCRATANSPLSEVDTLLLAAWLRAVLMPMDVRVRHGGEQTPGSDPAPRR